MAEGLRFVLALDAEPQPRVQPAETGLEQLKGCIWIENAKALHVFGSTCGLRSRGHSSHIEIILLGPCHKATGTAK